MKMVDLNDTLEHMSMPFVINGMNWIGDRTYELPYTNKITGVDSILLIEVPPADDMADYLTYESWMRSVADALMVSHRAST